ncbi:DNA repair protein RecO [Spirochaeta dissipatitropha]
MDRTKRISAVILKIYPIGESHAGVKLFSSDEGISSAVAHGLRSVKGRLRGKIAPFTIAEFDLYLNPVKNSCKILDVYSEDQLPGIRDNIERFYTANLWAEIVLKTHGGGQAAAFVYQLLIENLRLLDTCRAEGIRLLSIVFLIQWLDGVAGIDGDVFRKIHPAAQEFAHLILGQKTTNMHEIALPKDVQASLLGWCYRQLETEIESELNTLKTGRGIIV